MTQSAVALKILKDLIAIPSYVGEENPHSENGVVDYIEKWVRDNTDFNVERQILDGNRYNLIVKSGEPKTLFLAHTDTVPPSFNAKYDQLTPIEVDGELWGRGSTDMKSGIASLLSMLLLPEAKKKNFWILFYADEEYNFLGMKEFVKKFRSIRPELIVSADGSDLEIGLGCRGVIEIRMLVRGKSGHPAKGSGNSAIQGVLDSVTDLCDYLEQFEHPIMGKSSLNIGYILGGSEVEGSLIDNNLVKVGKYANVVADLCEAVLDIRPASNELNAKKIVNYIKAVITKKELQIEEINIAHDFESMYTEPGSLPLSLQRIINSYKYSNLKKIGYLDMQMAWDKLGRPPSIMFGSGYGATNHSNEERISIQQFAKGLSFYQDLISGID